MPAFGPDFRRAKSAWLYDAPATQSIWLVLGLTTALLLLHFVFQSVGAVTAYSLIFGGDLMAAFSGKSGPATADFMKASMVGLAPAALLTCLVAYVFSKIGRNSTGDNLALHFPKLGFLGWAAVIICFALFMYLVFVLTFVTLGIDPNTYSPAKGLQDEASKSGMVERTMAELRNNPLLFAFALPGVTLLVPLAEELMFRGALFSTIRKTALGSTGAVLISAGVWAVIHLVSAPALYVGVIFVMGIVLGLLLLRFGSLWVTIICHMVWNTMTSLAIFGMAQ
jgi:uncharacterized protein